MRRHIKFDRSVVVLVLVLLASPVQAQDEPTVKERDAHWQEAYQHEASSYRFATAGPQAKQLEMQPQPVMQWVSINDFNGDVFIWTLNGRPEVVGTIFSFASRTADRRNLIHEFHSLSEQPIEGTGAGNSFAFAPQAEWTPIPGAPIPAGLPARRQLQARALARQFSAHMKRQGERWELRLLNQPLYQYDDAADDVLGGALFAFVGYVTDPEILLLIEARETAGGPAWCYAAARFSDKSLWLSHRETEVWKFLDDVPSTDARYYLAPARTIAVPPAER